MQTIGFQGLRNVSLRLVLVVPFVLQISAAVRLVGYLSFRNSQQAVNNLAHQLISKVSRYNTFLSHILSVKVILSILTD
ncbi:MAG: hypothetical protein U7123_26355 [Potamolinea sp.]